MLYELQETMTFHTGVVDLEVPRGRVSICLTAVDERHHYPAGGEVDLITQRQPDRSQNGDHNNRQFQRQFHRLLVDQ